MTSGRLMKKSGLLKRFFSYLFLIAAANSEISVCRQEGREDVLRPFFNNDQSPIDKLVSGRQD
jgi:hypothetical protein